MFGKKSLRIIAALLMALVVAMFVSPIVDINPVAIAGVLFGASFVPMPSGIMASVAFISLEIEDGACSLGGVGTRIYFVDVKDITTFPDFTAVPTTPGQITTLSAAPTLAATKFWKFIDTPSEITELTFEADGKAGSYFFRVKGTTMYATISADAVGMAAMLNHGRIVMVIEDLASGIMYVLGNKILPLMPKVNVKAGKEFGDDRGLEISLENWATCRIPLLAPGTVLPIA